jgi:hypothetical protein
MLIDLFNRIIDLIPTPITNLILTNHFKDLRKYSRGDFETGSNREGSSGDSDRAVYADG